MFRKVYEYKIEQIEKCVENSAPQCEFTVGVLFMWADKERYMIEITDEVLTVKLTENGKTSYYVPQGSGDRIAAIKKILKENNGCARFTCVSNPDKELLLACGYESICTPSRNDFDYVYRAEDLIRLAGKKYHGKRNHINSFYAKHDNVKFELIKETSSEVYEFLDKYYEECASLTEFERDMVYSFVNMLENFDMKMGVLRADGKIVAITVGEIKGQTLYVHLEKALRSFEGAAEVINNEYAKIYRDDVVFINREDDNGSEGLRFAKTSYHPVFLIEKSNITLFRSNNNSDI